MLLFFAHDNKGEFRPVDRPARTGDQLVLSQGLTRDDATELVETFGFSKHLLRDVFDVNELPRIEADNGYQYIFLRNPDPSKNSVQSYPVLFVVGKHFFACLSSRKKSTESIVSLLNSNQPLPLQYLLISGILSIAKNYEEIIDHIGDRIDLIERRMRSHEADNQDFYSFVSIESNLGRAKMSLIGLSTVVEKLLSAATTKSERELYDDILLFAKQLLVEIDSNLQTIKSIRETYSTVANNTLNQRMKILTALTLLLAVPNLFYSMYGMNIALPFMHEWWAYVVIVGFTFLLVLMVYMLARKKRIF